MERVQRNGPTLTSNSTFVLATIIILIRHACPVLRKAYEQRGVWVGQGLVQRLGDKMS